MKKLKTLVMLSVITALMGCTQLLIGALNQVELTEIAIQNNKMYLLGDFNSKSYQQVKKAIEAHPEVQILVLTASSGSLDDDATFKLARYIRSKGLNTHLINQSVIASGAVDLFLSGVQRSIEKGAKLGVHSWSDGSKQAKDFPPNHSDHELNASYVRDMLGNDEFYWFTIYAAPADSVYWMAPKEVQRYQIITTKYLPPSNNQTPFGKAFYEERRSILED